MGARTGRPGAGHSEDCPPTRPALGQQCQWRVPMASSARARAPRASRRDHAEITHLCELCKVRSERRRGAARAGRVARSQPAQRSAADARAESAQQRARVTVVHGFAPARSPAHPGACVWQDGRFSRKMVMMVDFIGSPQGELCFCGHPERPPCDTHPSQPARWHAPRPRGARCDRGASAPTRSRNGAAPLRAEAHSRRAAPGTRARPPLRPRRPSSPPPRRACQPNASSVRTDGAAAAEDPRRADGHRTRHLIVVVITQARPCVRVQAPRRGGGGARERRAPATHAVDAAGRLRARARGGRPRAAGARGGLCQHQWPTRAPSSRASVSRRCAVGVRPGDGREGPPKRPAPLERSEWAG